MSDLEISLLAFACIVGGTLLGRVGRFFFPDHHVSDEAREAVELGVGTIASIAALVLGLLIASAKGTFDTKSGATRQVAARAILLDRVMAHYGPEAKEARESLRRGVASSIQRMWPEERNAAAMGKDPEAWVDIEIVQAELRQLSPKTVVTILVICAFSSAGALFSILELDAPYEGLLKVSSTPLHNAFAHLGQ